MGHSVAYYAEHARRPLNCWDCDGIRACKCSNRYIRSVKRGARNEWKRRMAEEAADPALFEDRLVMHRPGRAAFVYTDDGNVLALYGGG